MFLLERMLALLLSITVIPFRAVYRSGLFAGKVLFLGLIWCIAIPVMIGLRSYRSGDSLPEILIFAIFLNFPSIALMVAIGFIITGLCLIGNFFRVIWQGLENSFFEGLTGFWRIMDKPIIPFEFSFDAIFQTIVNENRDTDYAFHTFNTFNAFNALEDDRAASVDNLVVPNIEAEIAPQRITVPLQDSEINLADDLIKNSAQLNKSSGNVSKNIKQLKESITRYKQLSECINSIKSGLARGDLSDIEDQIIPHTEIKTPILVMKQYQENGNWHSVPSNSHITDKESLLTWLRVNPIHPRNRDEITNPPDYKGMPTRYRWRELTAQNCYVQELDEGAKKIRDLLKIILEQIRALGIEALPNNSLPSSSGFFSTPTVSKVSQETWLTSGINP